jgi:hypothetical protein
MSCGSFEYIQYKIDDVIGEIENYINHNNNKESLYSRNFSEETIRELNRALNVIKEANMYLINIDYLVSEDYFEKIFHKKIK